MLEEAVSSGAAAAFDRLSARHVDRASSEERGRLTVHQLKVLQLWPRLTPSQKAIALEVAEQLIDDASVPHGGEEDRAAQIVASMYLSGLRELGSHFYVMRDAVSGKESACEEYPEDGWTDDGNARVLDLCRLYRAFPGAKRLVREQLISEGHVHIVGAGAGAVQ